MNKIGKVLLAILGGIDTTFNLFTPIIIATLWISIAGFGDWRTVFFFGIGLTATLFRAIKIGFLNEY